MDPVDVDARHHLAHMDFEPAPGGPNVVGKAEVARAVRATRIDPRDRLWVYARELTNPGSDLWEFDSEGDSGTAEKRLQDKAQRLGVVLGDPAGEEMTAEEMIEHAEELWSLLGYDGEPGETHALFWKPEPRPIKHRSPLARPLQHGARHRRTSRPAPVRSRGSRRTTASRGSPSDDPEPPPNPVTPATAGALPPAREAIAA